MAMANTIKVPLNRPVVVTDFKIELPDSVREKYKIPTLQGTILNLQPPGGYKNPDLSKIQRSEDYLTDHWIRRGLIEPGSKYHLKFKDNFATLSKLCIPLDIPDKLLRIQDYFLGWTFQHDDVMDNKDLHTGMKGWSLIAKANIVFVDILKDVYGREYCDNFPDLDFPLFKPLCHAWKDFHALCHEMIPHYEARNVNFIRYMKDYFNSYELSHGIKINRRFSEESGKYWLRWSTGFKPWVEILTLIRGVDIPRKVRLDFYFIRLRMCSEDVLGFINDVFGVCKDLTNDEVDTLVMFKHQEKGIPFEQAHTETVDFLNEQQKDMMLLCDLIRKRYPGDEHVDGYLRGLEDFIDGYIIWCATCIRYGGKTAIKNRTVQPAPNPY